MESFYFKSVESFVDLNSRKSRDLTSSSAVRAPTLVPVFRHQKLTDFSISRILGLENGETEKESQCPGELKFKEYKYFSFAQYVI